MAKDAKYEQLVKDINNKNYAPIYLLQGDEAYFIDDISRKLETSVLDDSERDFNLAILYGKETEPKAVIDNVRQFPMLAAYRVVIIREAQDMKDIKLLQSYVDNPSDQSILVINYKYKKLDGRTEFVKKIAEKGQVLTTKKIYENQVGTWVIKFAKKYGLNIDQGPANMVGELLGTDISKLDKEIEKLSVILGEGHKVTADDVKIHIGLSKDYNVFELNNAIGLKDSLKANRIIAYFASNPKAGPLQMVISMLYSYFNKLMLVHDSEAKNNDALARSIGVHPFFMKEYFAASANYPKNKIIQVFQILAEYDLKSKGYNTPSSTKSEALMKELVFRILH